MIRKVFAIRDAKAEIFNLPWIKLTHGEAERDFRTLVNDNKEQSKIAMYPEDYDLYFLGDYDDVTGKMIPLDTPQHVLKAVNAVKQQAIQ